MDVQHVEKISYYPESGYSSKYYPYLNQDRYLQPFVMLKFEGLKRGVIVNIECKAWAKNIHLHRRNRKGYVVFEFLNDISEE